MFDTRDFSWSECEVSINNRIITEILGVQHAWNQEKEFMYGAGTRAHDIKRGNEEGRGVLRLRQEALERLQDAAPTGKLTELNVDIQIAYINNFGTMVRYSLLFCEFEGREISLNQNDKYAEIELPFLYLEERRA